MTASKLIALAAILLCSSLINGQQTLTPGPLGNTIAGIRRNPNLLTSAVDETGCTRCGHRRTGSAV